MKLLRVSLHPVQIEELVTDHGILVEELVELAKLEEYYGIVSLALDFPELFHGWTKPVPFIVRDEKGSWVIFRVVWPPTLGITDAIVPDEVGFAI